VKEEIVLRLTPQLIEIIRRRREQKLRAQKGFDTLVPGIVELGEIEKENYD
jgi:hypothetical protein